MGEIGPVQRPDPAINAPNLLGRVQQAGDHKHRHPQDEPHQEEDKVELHEEESPPSEVVPVFRPQEPSGGGLDLAV